jgi:regulator of sigma E protease
LAILSNVYSIVLVALGLGFVIFIHELGHFLLAKWNDVKVEKFSIGFGPTIFGFRRGETEYVLAAIPLGGFVKMLGEGPEDENNKSTDPRAYPNKSVGARMAIISAGVVMNIFLGLACFVYSYGRGLDVMPAKVGSVVPGSPAYKAGMRPGDNIVSIDGRRDINFTTLTLKVSLSAAGQVLRFGVERPGRDGLIEMDILPVRQANSERPTIGIVPADGLMIGTLQSPAGMADPPSSPGLLPIEEESLFDTLAAAGPADKEPTPLANAIDYEQMLAANLDQPIKHVIERRSASSGEDGPVQKRLELTLPKAQFVNFGMVLRIEPISAVQAGSPAEAAGFRPGDRIVKVGEDGEFDPMRLPYLCHKHAGKPMTFEVERTAAEGGRKVQTLTATPDTSPPWSWTDLSTEVDIPGLGLCYPVSPHIVAVKPGSPAARAGLKAGDVINSMVLKRSKAAKPSGRKSAGSEKPRTLKFDDGSATWVYAFGYIQVWRDLDIELVVNKASQPTAVQPESDPDWPYPSRGLMFLTLRRKMPPQPIGSALRLGYDDTIENVLSIYAMFRSLFTGRVGVGSLGGVITISRVAFGAARSGLPYLIHFLGILSINLAVLNFLPIPPLDGGQMVFLVAEKVRGRPLPESALIAGTYLGLFLVLGLMIFVTFQDIFRLF